MNKFQHCVNASPIRKFMIDVNNNNIRNMSSELTATELARPTKIPSHLTKSELIRIDLFLLLRKIEAILLEYELQSVFIKDQFSLVFVNENKTIHFKLEIYDNFSEDLHYYMKIKDYSSSSSIIEKIIQLCKR